MIVLGVLASALAIGFGFGIIARLLAMAIIRRTSKKSLVVAVGLIQAAIIGAAAGGFGGLIDNPFGGAVAGIIGGRLSGISGGMLGGLIGGLVGGSAGAPTGAVIGGLAAPVIGAALAAGGFAKIQRPPSSPPR